MKERPILFSGAMARALLNGSKTQTRRAVKLPHHNPLGQWEPSTVGGPDGGRLADGTTIPLQGSIWHTRTGDNLMCPYGQPGDRLWVRETHSFVPDSEDAAGCSAVLYSADCQQYGKLRPSIHMPRWASRTTLEITGVRVERLQDISEAECRAEGCAGGHGSIPGYQYNATPSEHFQRIWQSTGGDWDANPWVWVIEFRRIKP
jgi:hypothetical protein